MFVDMHLTQNFTRNLNLPLLKPYMEVKGMIFNKNDKSSI